MTMRESVLETRARDLAAKGKGLLAADESFPTIKKRFEALGIEATLQNAWANRGV